MTCVMVKALVDEGAIVLALHGMRHEIDVDEAEMVAESLVRQLDEGGDEIVLCTEPEEGAGCYDYSLTRQEAHIAAMAICAAASEVMGL